MTTVMVMVMGLMVMVMGARGEIFIGEFLLLEDFDNFIDRGSSVRIC
jgi:hypothetical protein